MAASPLIRAVAIVAALGACAAPAASTAHASRARTPLSAPTGLSASSVGATSFRLTWSAASANAGVTGYRVFLNGSRVATVSRTAYDFVSLACGTAYTAGVAAVKGGSVSATSSLAVATAACATAPQPVALPTIAGTTTVGATLSASPGTWSGSPTGFAFAWRRCDTSGAACQSVAGATASTYALASADAGLTVRVGVTATNAAGSTSATSAATPAIAPVAPLPPNPLAPRLLGVSVPWSVTWISDVDAYAARVGRMPSVVMWYSDFNVSMLNLTQMGNIAARGATPLVTVEPWDSSSQTDPRYTLKAIVRGDFDAWFAQGAEAAKTYGRTFDLRFAPEMNGAWAPWEAGINGNTPQDYVAAWRHVHGIFTSRGVQNVRWVWDPTVFGGGTAVDFTPYYPGSDVVDVLALDGYNWGSLDVWQTYSQVFGRSYDVLCALDATKPVMIAETASTEAGGDKAAWIESAFGQEIAARTPRVGIVVWFDANKETDWRVESSDASLRAFRAVATSDAWG